MTTAEQIAASKAMQEAEGNARIPVVDGKRTPDPVNQPVSDPAEPPEPAAPSAENEPEGNTGGPEGRPKPIYMSPQDQARLEMAKRFRHDDKGRVPFNGDMTDSEMLYGEFGREPSAEPEPEPQPEPVRQQEQQPQPEMITLTVRGQPVTKSREEWLADAAKVTAADSYLEEGRQLLDTARSLRKDNRERDPADPHRPEDRNNTQDGLTDPSLSADPQHPEDELEGAIEEVRYGTDAKEAAKKLRDVISKESDKAADERQIRRLVGNDDQKSAAALTKFREANPDLANDPNAHLLIANNLFAIQREELIAAGYKEDQLPKDNQTIAKWHQLSRIHGQAVSNQEQMLAKAKERLDQWRGVKPQAQPQPRKEAPRVEVNVNRDNRRANIPNQPTRSATPPPPRPQNQPAQPRDRSSIIANMRKGRGQIVA
jgi:hypothetical protein